MEKIEIKVSKCKCLEFERFINKKERQTIILNIKDTKKFYNLKTNLEREEFLKGIKHL